VKKLFWLLLLSCVPALSQTAAFNGLCSQGGTSAAVQGVQSTNKLAGIVPKCQVSVFLTGTTTPATIFADGAGTPLANPFYATALGSAAPGSWLFFAGTGQGYDVTMSNGTQTPVPGFPAGPVTLTDLIVTAGGGGGSGCTTTGAAGTLQGANGAGGCEPANVQVNGVNVPQSPNFTNSSTVTFSNPSGNTVTATAAPTLTIQHNGTSTGVDQTLLNFNDTPPSIPSGTVPVTFQTNTAGLVSGTVPASGAGIQPQIIPPIAGQSVTIFPTVATPTQGSSQNTVTLGQSLTSASFSRPACGAGGGQPGCDAPATSTVAWSGFSLPPGVSAANVTQIFAFAQATNFNQGGVGAQINSAMSCTFASADLINTQSTNYLTQPFSVQLTGATGTSIPSITCTANFQDSGATIMNGLNFNVNVVALVVYYTGSVVTQPNVVNIAPCLSYNPASNILSLPEPCNYAVAGDTSDAYTVNIPEFTSSFIPVGAVISFSPPNNGSNTTTTPTLNVNGFGPITIVKGPGHTPLAPNDIVSQNISCGAVACVSTVQYDGLFYVLQNPQTSSGGGGAVSSVFGRTGAVVATSGDYTVSQITGASPLASPALTGTPTAPTQSCASNTDIATGAYVAACAGSGSGSINVNGTAVSNPNFNSTTPAASAGVNATFNVSGSNVSANVPAATSSTEGVVKPDGTSCTVTAGVLTCTGSSGSTSIAICADTSGSGTAQSCTTSPSFTPVAGSVIAYTTTTPNSGTSLTENVNGLGAKPVAKWQTTTTLAANDVRANTFILETFDGTNWELATIGNAPASGGGTTFQNSLLPFPPAASSFTEAGQPDNITVTTVGGLLVANIGETIPIAWSFLMQSNAFSTPYSIAAEFSDISPQPQSGGAAQTAGLYLSDGTKFEGVECLQNPDGSLLRVEHFTNFSTDGGTVFGPDAFVATSTVLPFTTSCTQGAMYARWRNNGTTLFADVSPDGVVWQNVYSEAVGSFITPTSYGWGGADNIGDGGILVKLGGWLPTNSAAQ
jgi:hypothetical protein